MKIIIVDDDQINNLVCKHVILRFDSYADIEVFTEPEKVLTRIKNEFEQTGETQDMILFLDINMPYMNGWEFLDEFEKYPDMVHKHITIYIVSSSIDGIDRDKADANKFVKGFYSKPLSIEVIKQILSCK